MSEDLSDKQRAFLAEYLIDRNGTRAAIRAGYSPRSASTTASRLLALPAIRSAIDQHQAAACEEARVTIGTLLAEAEAARAVAEEAGQASGMVSASLFKARLLGLLIEKTEDQVARNRLEVEQAQHAELKSAAALLAAAATSLGLPARATPAQIVGALASRPIATPEAFALLRAGREGG